MWILLHILTAAVGTCRAADAPSGDVPHRMVNLWATNFGNILSEVCRQNTSRDAILQSFSREASVVTVDAMNLLTPMVEQIVQMMGSKRQAVQRIVDTAEAASLSHTYDPQLLVNYLNAKRLNQYQSDGSDLSLKQGYRELKLTNSSHQFSHIPVNMTHSTVHVPTNVYDKAPDVMNAIYWSQKLDRIFATNYKNDPSLSWQYFGSSTGFMRQYPGMKWLVDENEPDLYDCRVREWYIRAASSPKDVVILLDLSGSMTGLRLEIAKHVVLNILDTLNANDYVTIYNFSQQADPLYPCFADTLVQANLENIRIFKEALDTVETKELANFTSALTQAFQMLKKTQESGRGALCNQAIMLITDGAPYHYEEVFNKYNRPDKQIRFFTFLIGRDVTDSEAVQWMACENKGYYTKVTTLAEVGEQVQKYVPVLARPWVLYRTQHPAIWTGVYADVADPKLTDWLWEIRERARQLERSKNYQKILMYSTGPMDQQMENVSLQCYDDVETFLTYGRNRLNRSERQRIEAQRYINSRLDLREMENINKWTLLIGRSNSETTRRGYRLMTTVAMPVFDKHKVRNVTEKLYTNTTRWVYRTREKRVALLLGVAGTDVPISDIEKLCPPHQLGVNGYSFMVDNNGFVLYHPDMRPVLALEFIRWEKLIMPKMTRTMRQHRESTKQFQEILKPNYNTVDLSEVEIGDFDEPTFNFSKLDAVRRNMIDRRSAETAFNVRQHYDEMRRVIVRYQRYSYAPVDGTPFSLAIVLPGRYGDKRISGQVEVSQAVKSREPIGQYFEGPNWSVHPEWVYCEYDNHAVTDAHSLDTPQKQYLHFLQKAMTTTNFEWRSLRLYPAPQLKKTHKYMSSNEGSGTYFCDRDLFQSVIFDARVTMPFLEEQPIFNTNVEGLYKTFGAAHSFVATRSGFTRWKTHWPSSVEADNQDLAFRGFRATDETWYRRAVDFNERDESSFVFSVPFDAGLRNETLVTGAQALFLTKGGKRAPAAVVGMQFLLSKFREKFLSTANCPSLGNCTQTCASDDLDCYLLDDSGYVVVSKRHEETGRFFGEVEGTVLSALLQHNVYYRKKMFDYQGVCLDVVSTGSTGWTLATPVRYVQWFFGWLGAKLLWLVVQTSVLHLLDANLAWAAEHIIYDDEFVAEARTEEYPADDGRRQPVEYEGDCPPELVVENDQLFRMAHINKTRPRPCHKHADLLILNPDAKQLKASLNFCYGIDGQSCGRKFVLEKLPYTNLLLLVVNTLCPCENEPISVLPEEWQYPDFNGSECRRQRHEAYRRRPNGCQKYHAEEENIDMCGRDSAATSWAPLRWLVVVQLLVTWWQR